MAFIKNRALIIAALALGIWLVAGICLPGLGLIAVAKANVFNLPNRGQVPVPVQQEMKALEDERGGRFITWSLEDKAMSETLNLDEGLALRIEDDPIHTLPGDADIPETEALAIAKEAVTDKYLITAERLDTFEVYTSFIRREGADDTFWVFDFEPERVGSDGRFHVEIASATGVPTRSTWTFGDFWDAAPTLAQLGKAEAILEHIGDEAFAALPLAEKAKYSDLLREAGYAPFAGGYYHILSGEEDVQEQEAIQAATAAVKDAYGFTDAVLAAMVEVNPSFMQTPEGERRWVVEFSPTPYRERYGVYRVELAGGDAQVLSVSWSLEDAYDKATPADDLSGDVLGAAQLTTLLTLTEQQQRLAAEMEEELGLPFEAWSLEDQARLSAFWVENGHPKEDMILYVLPGEGDISEEDALRFARETLTDTFRLTAETLDKFTVYQSFMAMPYNLESVWSFYFVPAAYEDIHLGEYRVEFTSPSYVVEYCNHYVEVGYLGPQPPQDGEGQG